MEVLTYWEKKGRVEGKEELVVGQIERRFGPLPDRIRARLEPLNADQLDELGLALLDCATLKDSENGLEQKQWLREGSRGQIVGKATGRYCQTTNT